MKAEIEYWCMGAHCEDTKWEQAYRRFETPEQEVRKFTTRLKKLGVDRIPRDGLVAELFCGRGNGLVALERLGFRRLVGVDLSPSLLSQYAGSAKRIVGDCRDLRFERESLSLIVIQGGLHHLPDLRRDLPRVLDQIHRNLTPEGQLILVEPWNDLFLRTVHSITLKTPAGRLVPKLDALRTMIELERQTYFPWLSDSEFVNAEITSRFDPSVSQIRFGKFLFSGCPKSACEIADDELS
jgi:SAM-dependent methyltransferase